MIRGLILTGLMVLLCHTDVRAHISSTHTSTSNMAKLKALLQQFQALVAEQTSETDTDYEDSSMTEQSPAATSWDRDTEQEDTNPAERLDTQRNRLIDLLMSTRSKSLSGCFGGRLDRIGSSSTLGCNSKKG